MINLSPANFSPYCFVKDKSGFGYISLNISYWREFTSKSCVNNTKTKELNVSRLLPLNHSFITFKDYLIFLSLKINITTARRIQNESRNIQLQNTWIYIRKFLHTLLNEILNPRLFILSIAHDKQNTFAVTSHWFAPSYYVPRYIPRFLNNKIRIHNFPSKFLSPFESQSRHDLPSQNNWRLSILRSLFSHDQSSSNTQPRLNRPSRGCIPSVWRYRRKWRER